MNCATARAEAAGPPGRNLGRVPDVTDDEPRITLIGKPGCHLCEDARAVVKKVASETGTDWRELSILDHPELAEIYWEQIPVVLVDGKQHTYWRVDEDRLRAALTRRKRLFSRRDR